MQKMGAEYNYPPLSAWGERLQLEVQRIDIDALPQTLEKFPHIIKQIQSLVSA